MMEQLLANALSGVFIGSFYALMALGLAIIFGTMGIVNFAHGDFITYGGYVAFYLYTFIIPFGIIAFPLVLLLTFGTMFLLGLVIFLRPLQYSLEKPFLYSLILTFGLSTLMRDLLRSIVGVTYKDLSLPALTGSIFFFSIPFRKVLVFTSFICFGLIAIVVFFLRRTSWGLALRASSQVGELAEACGIPVKKIQMISFGLGIGLAGVAGFAVALNYSIYPSVGFGNYLLKSFAVVILGGLGSVPGAILGGILLGVTESLVTWMTSHLIAMAIYYAIILTVLVIRPTGLFGEEVGEG